MEFPRLEISRQDAEIEIRTTRARVEITTRRPQFRLRRSLARFRLESHMPTMRLDRTAMYNALGIGPVLQAARQYFSDSVQRCIENTGAVAEDGNALMRIENGGSPLADIGAQALETPDRNLSVSMLPPPQIDWEPGYININWTPGSIETQWDVSAHADIRVEPHYVEIRMKKYPEVRIRVAYDERRRKNGGKFIDQYL